MKLLNLVNGLLTLAPYYDHGGEGYPLAADHDIIYATATDRPLSPEDVERMIGFGWFQPEVEYAGDEMTPSDYDPEESWAAYA